MLDSEWTLAWKLTGIALAMAVQFVLMTAVFWYYRKGRLLPENVAERQLWACSNQLPLRSTRNSPPSGPFGSFRGPVR